MTAGIEKAVLAGGHVPNATYRNHGTHAEAIEITFPPETISYRQILEFFFRYMIRPLVIATAMMPEAAIDLCFSIKMSNKSRLSKRPSLMLMPPGYGREKLSLKSCPRAHSGRAEPEHQNYLERYPSWYSCYFIRPNWRLPGRTKAAKMQS